MSGRILSTVLRRPLKRRPLGQRRIVVTGRFAAGVLGAVVPAVLAQVPPGSLVSAGESHPLALEPAGLATYSAALSGVGAGNTAGIRYQLDLTWITAESPTAGVTHDGLTFSLLSLDGSTALPVLTLDAFGLQVLPGSGVSVLIDPASRPQDLSYRAFLVPPAQFLADGSWAVFDLVDTGPLGGSSALAAVSLVPEPGSIALGLLGLGWLGWQAGLRSRSRSRMQRPEVRR